MDGRNEIEEAEAAEHFYSGSASAFESAQHIVLEMAKDAFARHEDDKAGLLRDLAKTFSGRAEQEREMQKAQREIVNLGEPTQ